MTTITCKNCCCNLKVEEFTSDYNNISKKKTNKSKAGVFIIDPESKKIYWWPRGSYLKHRNMALFVVLLEK